MGIYDKYKIIKTDGSQVKPDSEYFVLKLNNDRSAQRPT